MLKTETLAYKLGVKIRTLRRGAELTQEQLAEAVQVSTNFIGYIERGQRAPSIDTLERIAMVLEIDPKEMFEFSETDEEPFEEVLLAELRKLTPDDVRRLSALAKQLR